MNSENPFADQGPFSQDVRVNQNTARVPEKVRGGVCATGAVVLNGPHEFMVDFVQRLAMPQQLAARVIVPPTLMPAFIKALADNISNYTNRFGPPPTLPSPPPGTPVPPIHEVYDQMKIEDETLGGTYCNAVMIAHSPAEFCLDFITSGFPRSVVSARVMIAAPHAPKLLDSLKKSYDQYQKRQTPPPEEGQQY
jgi:hypothetical protein